VKVSTERVGAEDLKSLMKLMTGVVRGADGYKLLMELKTC
jgi:hypothetical protein